MKAFINLLLDAGIPVKDKYLSEDQKEKNEEVKQKWLKVKGDDNESN